MDTTATLEARCRPDDLFAWVDTLDHYPRWLDIVPAVAAIDDDDGRPAWLVTLRGQVGPLARRKRLRMVRTVHDDPTHARFERAELDGRPHASWELDVDVEETSDGARLHMRLHYGGSLWVPMLDRLLQRTIEASRRRLADLVEHGRPEPAG